MQMNSLWWDLCRMDGTYRGTVLDVSNYSPSCTVIGSQQCYTSCLSYVAEITAHSLQQQEWQQGPGSTVMTHDTPHLGV
jgi:hypothetical protein